MAGSYERISQEPELQPYHWYFFRRLQGQRLRDQLSSCTLLCPLKTQCRGFALYSLNDHGTTLFYTLAAHASNLTLAEVVQLNITAHGLFIIYSLRFYCLCLQQVCLESESSLFYLRTLHVIRNRTCLQLLRNAYEAKSERNSWDEGIQRTLSIPCLLMSL